MSGEAIRLTRREFELLRYLVENRNRVLSRDRLLERVWGYDRFVETRSVDVHVGRLRGKLREAGRQNRNGRRIGLSVRRVDQDSFQPALASDAASARTSCETRSRRGASPCSGCSKGSDCPVPLVTSHPRLPASEMVKRLV